MMKNIAIFASGNGTNAENITRYFRNGEVGNVKLLLTNRQHAFVLERARALDVPYFYKNKEEWSEGTLIYQLLQEHHIDWVILAGFLARVPEIVLQAYPHHIINIHPSLLPKFGGKGMYGNHVHEAVIAAGEVESGITIHYVNERYDEGQVIAQYRCPVFPTDTPAALAARVHALEYKFYPLVIERLMND